MEKPAGWLARSARARRAVPSSPAGLNSSEASAKALRITPQNLFNPLFFTLPTCILLTPEELSWVACAIDAEGSIAPFRQSVKLQNGKFYGPYGPYWKVNVYNQNKQFVERFASLTGARIYAYNGNGLRHHQMFQAGLGGKRLKPLLLAILPYLIVKREKALEALRVLK